MVFVKEYFKMHQLYKERLKTPFTKNSYLIIKKYRPTILINKVFSTDTLLLLVL